MMQLFSPVATPTSRTFLSGTIHSGIMGPHIKCHILLVYSSFFLQNNWIVTAVCIVPFLRTHLRSSEEDLRLGQFLCSKGISSQISLPVLACMRWTRQWIYLLASCLSFVNALQHFFAVRLNGSRVITGILRGFDPFMNLVLDETVEETKGGEKHNIGMVVSTYHGKITGRWRLYYSGTWDSCSFFFFSGCQGKQYCPPWKSG